MAFLQALGRILTYAGKVLEEEAYSAPVSGSCKLCRLNHPLPYDPRRPTQ